MRLIDNATTSELRMWALSGLLQNAHLIPDVDGTLFLSTGCAYPVFTAMRRLYECGVDVDEPSMFVASEYNWSVALGAAALFDGDISEDQTQYYLEELRRRLDEPRI